MMKSPSTQISKEKQQQMLAESIALTHQLHTNGQYLSASPLQPAATAVIVRVREGKPMVTDGPFIETREQIAGYFLIDAKDLNEATQHRRAECQERASAPSKCGRCGRFPGCRENNTRRHYAENHAMPMVR